MEHWEQRIADIAAEVVARSDRSWVAEEEVAKRIHADIGELLDGQKALARIVARQAVADAISWEQSG